MATDVGLIIGLECSIAIAVLILINFVLGGLLAPFMKVKMSRGKKLLVRVLHPVQSYFVVGQLDEGFLIFKDRQKNDRRIMYTGGCIDRAVGVYWIAVDDEKNCLVSRLDGEGINGFDAVKYDELYKRALYKPNVMNELLLKIALIMIGVALIVLVAVAIFSFKSMQNTNHIIDLLSVPVKAMTSTTGGVI